jgi:hypothetical protein
VVRLFMRELSAFISELMVIRLNMVNIFISAVISEVKVTMLKKGH